MGDFLIDLPHHKRWWLPDGKHVFNSVIYGDDIRYSVIEMDRFKTKESITVKIDPTGKWKDVGDTFQELANKKYRKELRHKSQEKRDRAFQRGHTMRHKSGEHY